MRIIILASALWASAALAQETPKTAASNAPASEAPASAASEAAPSTPAAKNKSRREQKPLTITKEIDAVLPGGATIEPSPSVGDLLKGNAKGGTKGAGGK